MVTGPGPGTHKEIELGKVACHKSMTTEVLFFAIMTLYENNR